MNKKLVIVSIVVVILLSISMVSTADMLKDNKKGSLCICYEYEVTHVPESIQSINEHMNERGVDGWDVCAITREPNRGYMVFWKRPIL